MRYPFHPLAGREVVIRIGERYANGTRVVEDDARRVFAFVPSWMFEPRCNEMGVESVARVSLDALDELDVLLRARLERLDVRREEVEIGSYGPTEKGQEAKAARDGAARRTVGTGVVDVATGAGATRGDAAARATAGATRARGSKRRGGAR